jgi:NADH dehydrogenase FAD-containing subunit
LKTLNHLSSLKQGVAFLMLHRLVFLVTLVLLFSSTTILGMPRHILLVGGGHAHVQVLKAFHANALQQYDTTVTVVDTYATATYSGMLPGCLASLYEPSDIVIPLEPLAARASITFVQDTVVNVDLEQKLCYLMNDSSNVISFDVVSFDIGSTSRGLDATPGAREFCIPTRPIQSMVQRCLRETTLDGTLVVVGGGVAGIELALSLSLSSSNVSQTILLNSGSELLSNEKGRYKLLEILNDANITVKNDCVVTEVTNDTILLSNGATISYDHCIWATGAGPHALTRELERRGLHVTAEGWIAVRPTLQSTSHDFVFCAGDASSIVGLPNGLTSPPKAGLYAVRAGPVLIENLLRFLNKKELVQYTPQDDFLKLLVCGREKAIGFRFGLAFHGHWVWKLKDHIDRTFMDLFDVSKLASPSGDSLDTSQYDAIASDQEPPPLTPEDGAFLLQRSDDDVDYMLAWKVLRTMARMPDYRDKVVALLESKPMAVL